MFEVRGGIRDDPSADETNRHVGERAHVGFVFFLGCVILSTVFEILNFPERTPWMLAFAAGFAALSAVGLALVRAYPTRSVPTLIAFANIVGAALNAYHAIVGASVAMCLWTLTGLMGSTAVFLRWGAFNQCLAAAGTLLFYPLHLATGHVDPLTWAAGGAYLLIMVSMSVFGSGAYAGYLRSGRQLARTLSQREAELQSFFDLAPVGTAIVRPDGTFREINDALCRVLGHSRDELLRRNWFHLAHADDRDALAAHARDALTGSAAARAHEVQLVHRDGTTIHAAVDMQGLPGAGGAVDHLMVLVQDITVRKRIDDERERLLSAEFEARQQAEAASRAKDDFLATLSHELRTPLSPILAWSDLLRRHLVPPEQADRGLAAIARNAAAQARLIDELLDVSRIVSGKLRLELHPLDLAPIILDAIDGIRPAAEAKGIRIETAIDANGCRVLGDPDRLRQVMWNLLSNAVKFTPAGGRIDVGLAADVGDARIVVTDTGQGIAADFLPVVFERFRQADTTSTRRHGGLGLGLAIVRELVELHGGRIGVDSAGEGQGATFTVSVPLVAPDHRVEPVRTSRVADATLDGIRVLVVDDDPDSNDVVRTLLASFGAEVRTAGSAVEALDVVDRWVPDVVVSDIAMPGEDGYALLARMRARELLGGVPAIALSAYSAPRDRERALRAGFDAHVAKPVRTPELVHAVLAARDARARLLQ
jgi:PAS domain S-box-containing protein